MKHSNLLYFLTGLSILVYVAIRAFTLDATYDEVWTWQIYVPLEIREILNCTPCDANNHILNSLLIKTFTWIGGDTLFIMRLPNVLAFVIYLYFSFRIATQHLKPFFAGLCFFILSWCNPFLLDFFSLARGYGLSLGFTMASLYFLLNFFKNPSLRSATLSILLAGFSVLSNLSTVNFYLAVAIVIFLYSLLKAPQQDLSRRLPYPVLLVSLVLFVILYEPVRKLISQGNLYYGGITGFYEDTLISLTAFSLGNPYDLTNASLVLNILIVLFVIVLLISVIRLKKLSYKVFLLLILLLPVLSNIAQFFLFRTPYLIDRTAIFYYPLFIINLSVWSNIEDKHYLSRLISRGVPAVLILVFLFNLIRNANFFKTVTWPHDSRTTEILDYLQSHAKGEGAIINLDSSWPFERSLKYHLEKNTYPVRYIKRTRNAVEKEAEYFLYFSRSLSKVGYDAGSQPVLHLRKDTVLNYPDEGIILFRLTE